MTPYQNILINFDLIRTNNNGYFVACFVEVTWVAEIQCNEPYCGITVFATRVNTEK